MLGEADPVEVAKPSTSQLKPVLDNEELKELARGILEKKQAKEAVSENARYKSKVDRILGKVHAGDIADGMVSEEFRLALIDGLKQDKREHQVEKIKRAGGKDKKGKGCA